MRKTYWATVGVIVLVLVGIFVVKSSKGESENNVLSESVANSQSIASSPEPEESSMSAKKIYDKAPEALKATEIDGKKATIKTAKGNIVFKLFGDAPLAASNFIFLAKDGFYDGVTFHRREEGFVIQGGDPRGDGTGGPGYSFEDEPVMKDYNRGIVAMANAGPDTNGSQFFIMLADTPLPKSYTIFGEVVSGIDVVDKIAVGDVMQTVTID